MSAFPLALAAPLPCHARCSIRAVCNRKAAGFVVDSEAWSANHVSRGSLFINVSTFAAPTQVGDVVPPFCTLLALGFCSIGIFGPCQSSLAETGKQPNDEILICTRIPQRPPAGNFIVPEISPASSAEAPHLQSLNSLAAEGNPNVEEKIYRPLWGDSFSAEKGQHSQKKNCIAGEENLRTIERISISNRINVPWFHEQAVFQISSSTVEQTKPFLDFAGVLSPARSNSLLNDIYTLEAETGWKLRVITKSGSSPSIPGKDLKDLWKPDEKTVIVIEDISSPNILNFNAGADVIVKLPRQFFLELQSRYGNQFYVQQEGEGSALISTVQAIRECLSRPEGCKNVPGLTTDLYYLTLATSIAGGCVFGFAARLPPSGRVEASWQWIVFLSPLWLLLFISFGILPVVGRTSEPEPLLKNALGFCAGAIALYLTPIFGPSPISKR